MARVQMTAVRQPLPPRALAEVGGPQGPSRGGVGGTTSAGCKPWGLQLREEESARPAPRVGQAQGSLCRCSQDTRRWCREGSLQAPGRLLQVFPAVPHTCRWGSGLKAPGVVFARKILQGREWAPGWQAHPTLPMRTAIVAPQGHGGSQGPPVCGPSSEAARPASQGHLPKQRGLGQQPTNKRARGAPLLTLERESWLLAC